MNILIFAAVLSQIWLLSYFYPKQVTRRIDYVLEHCPKDTYPKLYPVSVDTIKLIKNSYLALNYLCIAVGLWLLYYFAILPEDPMDNANLLDDIPLLYGMLQCLPILLLELVCYKQLKLMRELNNKSSRKAELQPRLLFNYVRPSYLVLAVVVYLGYIVSELFINDFTLLSDAGIKITSVTLANLLFIILAYRNIYGKKQDPYQSSADRYKQTQFAVHSFVCISIFMTLFLMAHSWVNTNQHQYAEILINSLYFQVIALFSLGALLSRFKIEEIDFDVYKADAPQA